MDAITRLFWRVGLTHEARLEYSEILYETIKVSLKRHETSSEEPHKRLWHENLEKYFIDFESNGGNHETHLTLNSKELYECLKGGDKVKLGYVMLHEAEYNYIPDNFAKKQRINSIFLAYLPMSIESDKLRNRVYEIPESVRERISEKAYRAHHPKF
ncbi:Uncharacterised protein [uncultured archaeon]|nr:Uncharacterised protein [uncultured archaeon]